MNGVPPCIQIGGMDKPALLLRLAEARMRLNPLAEQLFADPRFTTSTPSRQVELVAITAAGLGFEAGAPFGPLSARAAARGLALCPLELAPHLRLQFPGQAEGAAGRPATQHRAPAESVTIASAPPGDEHDIPWGFYVRRIDGALWLRGYRSWSGHVWAPEDVLVFMRRQDVACDR